MVALQLPSPLTGTLPAKAYEDLKGSSPIARDGAARRVAKR
jgi:hypothetical protein